MISTFLCSSLFMVNALMILGKYFFFFPLLGYLCNFLLMMQHPYVYGVLVFEAMATFIGQVSVLSLIAIFGAATTAMV